MEVSANEHADFRTQQEQRDRQSAFLDEAEDRGLGSLDERLEAADERFSTRSVAIDLVALSATGWR